MTITQQFQYSLHRFNETVMWEDFYIVAHSVLSPELSGDTYKGSDEEIESHHIWDGSPGFMSFKCCSLKKDFLENGIP